MTVSEVLTLFLATVPSWDLLHCWQSKLFWIVMKIKIYNPLLQIRDRYSSENISQ